MVEELEIAGLHAEARGPEDGPLVICVHGLSANLRGFDVLAEALAAAGSRVVAVDLRGRGGTPDSGPGTYGLASHARDVLAVADALGAERFALVGWSMGAFITLAVAEQAGDRLTHAVLVDAAGEVDGSAEDAVRAGLARLDAVVPDPETYLAAVRAAGVIEPWEPFWDEYYRYELGRLDDGTWSPRTSRTAAEEDLEDIVATDHHARWAALAMPTLLVRCNAPLGGGLLVPEAERDALVAAVPGVTVHEAAPSHFRVITDPEAIAAVVAHLRR